MTMRGRLGPYATKLRLMPKTDQVADPPQHRVIGPLTERLQTLADSRHRCGRRHSFVSVLLVACSAVLTGARSFAAIGQ